MISRDQRVLGLGLASLKGLGLGLESSPKMIKSQAFGHKKGHFCCYGLQIFHDFFILLWRLVSSCVRFFIIDF